MSVDKDSGKGMTLADHLNARLANEVREITKPGMTNAQIAERLSPDLVSLFWRRQLNAFFASELS